MVVSILVKANTEDLKQATCTREGQRGSLSPSLSTASDSDSNEERRSAFVGLASALRRKDARQTEEEGNDRQKKQDIYK